MQLKISWLVAGGKWGGGEWGAGVDRIFLQLKKHLYKKISTWISKKVLIENCRNSATRIRPRRDIFDITASPSNAHPKQPKESNSSEGEENERR